MIDLSARRLAQAAGGELAAGDPERAGPARVVIDSREVEAGDLFVGLPGAAAHGGEFAEAALDAGAWGVITGREHAAGAVAAAGDTIGHSACTGAAVIAVDDPLAALHGLARAWRQELGAKVLAVTGSTGKTSTKDILAALLSPRLATYASRENWNTEIGLPLTILEAPRGTEALVLEMAMRGEGQIAELVAIAEPDVGVIVNVGPVHLELLGTVERVAAAKAELIRDLRPGAACVVPASEPLLDAHLRRDELDTWTFGPGGEVRLLAFDAGRAEIEARQETVQLELGYSEPHNLLNTLAAVAAARALDVPIRGRVSVRFSSLRGELVELPGGVTVVNDCYNANPMSMRAALDHLAASAAARRVAVLGAMAELGEGSDDYHHEIGAHAAALGIDVLVPVGEGALGYSERFDGETHPVATPEEAAALLEELARPGDRVLIKGSRSVGLERVLA
ncbi:MAG: UDP-N-acetylmuramoyl-tripeptide--D-alanyl-D-alanine ligase [Thermoleophilaceae bacterium]|jgi:UDP-N-acetylmuramoyl-tripeptide--D-alanyl-D-alanine ligase|nr:UDP-N-acetylmuramoyl-tripeptide--D-alanyl-D-alanine ligase [Thermoleophilaceae bacterium]